MMNSIDSDIFPPKRSGRAEARFVLLFVLGVPLAVVAYFWKSWVRWLDVFHEYAPEFLSKYEQVAGWLAVATFCMGSVVTVHFILQILEHVLVTYSSNIVVQPSYCGRLTTSDSSEKCLNRYRYEILGRTYFKLFHTSLEEPNPDFLLHVNPFNPKLAVHQDQMNSSMMGIHVFFSMSSIYFQLLLLVVAAYNLQNAPVIELVIGLCCCLLLAFLFQMYYRKHSISYEQSLSLALLIGEMIFCCGSTVLGHDRNPFRSSGRTDTVAKGYVASA